MAYLKYLALLLVGAAALALALPYPETPLITSPEAGQEYVYVQSSASGSRPIERKDKNPENQDRETSHKIPQSLQFALNQEDKDSEVENPMVPLKKEKPLKKVIKRSASPGGAAPAPAGAIRIDINELKNKYMAVLKTSTTPRPTKPKETTTKGSRKRGHKTSSITTSTTTTTTEASKVKPGRGRGRRVKKEASDIEPQLVSGAVLTTAAPTVKKLDLDDVPLVAQGSEKQRSRIQIKKGPNGQDYEYEYVYYYYDDDEDSKDNQKVSNAHDGPARNQISRGDQKTSAKTGSKAAAAEANEVVPSASRQRTRGRQLGEEDTVNEERLPANTRFPPRSRNLNTTPLPEEEEDVKPTANRRRGRPTTEATAADDSVSDETQGTRGRTRPNVRRPNLELVDSATFNTHNTQAAGAEPPAGGPSFPAELPAGPVENAEDEPAVKKAAPVTEEIEESNPPASDKESDATTPMSAMDKVALDLYAVVQGTQKLSGEEGELSTEETTGDNTEATTLEAITEPIETTTPTTTTTTTTTTTPAPTTTTTTTTTTEAPLGRGGKYRPRAGLGGRRTSTSTTEASANAEPTKKSKFARPGFGGRRQLGAKTTAEPAVEQEATKEESKPVSHSRPTLSRSRFGTGSRTRGRTTAAPASDDGNNNEEAPASSTTQRSGALPRQRPTFNLRSRGRTTAAPQVQDSEAAGNEEAHESSPAEVQSTTAKSRRISGGNNVRPLRPGPRINLANRRGAATTTTTTEVPEDHVAGDEVPTNEENKSEEPAPQPDSSPLHRLKNKNNRVQVKPKAAASAPVQVRRVNPLLNRRRPGQTTEAPVVSSEAPQEVAATEEVVEEEVKQQEQEAPSSTEEPKGLGRLLAGRRRLANRQPEISSTTESLSDTEPKAFKIRTRRPTTTTTTESTSDENLVKSETQSLGYSRSKTRGTTASPLDLLELSTVEATTKKVSRRRPTFSFNRLKTTEAVAEEATTLMPGDVDVAATQSTRRGFRPGPKVRLSARRNKEASSTSAPSSSFMEKRRKLFVKSKSSSTSTAAPTSTTSTSTEVPSAEITEQDVTIEDVEATTVVTTSTEKQTGVGGLIARRRLKQQLA